MKVILYSEKNIKIKETRLNRGSTLKLGRNPDKTDITITDGTVSRIHAEIQSTKDGRFVIKDLNSANGTYIEGAQIQAGQEEVLQVGKKFSLGESKNYLILHERSASSSSKSSNSLISNRIHKSFNSYSRASSSIKRRKHKRNKHQKSRSRSRHREHQSSKKQIDLKYRDKHKTNEDSYKSRRDKATVASEAPKTSKECQIKEEKISAPNFKYDPLLLKYYEEFIRLRREEDSLSQVKARLPKLIDNELLNKKEDSELKSNLDLHRDSLN